MTGADKIGTEAQPDTMVKTYHVGMEELPDGGCIYYVRVNDNGCKPYKDVNALVDACFLSIEPPINDGAGHDPLDADIYDDLIKRWRFAREGDSAAEV